MLSVYAKKKHAFPVLHGGSGHLLLTSCGKASTLSSVIIVCKGGGKTKNESGGNKSKTSKEQREGGGDGDKKPEKSHGNEGGRKQASSGGGGDDDKDQYFLLQLHPRHKMCFKAATVIQRFWRNFCVLGRNRTVDYMLAFLRKNLTIEYYESVTFDTVISSLGNPMLIAFTNKLLRRLQNINIYGKTGMPDDVRIQHAAVTTRMFLAAYMITAKPASVFNNERNPLAIELKMAAAEMLNAILPMFSRFVANNNQNGAVTSAKKKWRYIDDPVMKQIPFILVRYGTSFQAWKVPDSKRLGHNIRNALIALYLSINSISGAEDEANISMTMREFKTQIVRLRTKLQDIEGKPALEAFDRQFLVNTGIVENGSNINDGGARQGTDINHIIDINSYTIEDNFIRKPKSWRELYLSALYYPNVQLNDNVEEETGNEYGEKDNAAIREQIVKNFHNVYWDLVADDLCLTPQPNYERFLNLLDDIRKTLICLIGEHNNNSSRIAIVIEIINIPVIKDEIESRGISIGSFLVMTDKIVDIMVISQAPYRGDDLKISYIEKRALLESAVATDDTNSGGGGGADDQSGSDHSICSQGQGRFVADIIRIIKEHTKKMQVDATNTRLTMLRTAIQRDGYTFECTRFEEDLTSGLVSAGLEKTRNWLKQMLLKESEFSRLAATVSSVQLASPAVQNAMQNFYQAALIAYAIDEPSFSLVWSTKYNESHPEILRMDTRRVQYIYQAFYGLSKLLTFFIVVGEMAKETVTIQQQQQQTIDGKMTVFEGLELVEMMKADAALCDGNAKLMEFLNRRDVKTMLECFEAVHLLILERLRAAFYEIASFSSLSWPGDDGDKKAVIQEKYKVLGCNTLITDQLFALVKKTKKIGDVNWKIHGTRLSGLIIELAGQQMQ